jgi:hypothetical protein
MGFLWAKKNARRGRLLQLFEPANEKNQVPQNERNSFAFSAKFDHDFLWQKKSPVKGFF